MQFGRHNDDEATDAHALSRRLQLSARRRQYRWRIGGVGVVVVAAVVVATIVAPDSPKHRPTPAIAPVNATQVPTSKPGPTLNAIQRENQQGGAKDIWRIFGGSDYIAGYADRVSAQRGEKVKFFVSSWSPKFHVEGYRMGWYQGTGARLVWVSPDETGVVQSPPTIDRKTNTARVDWKPSLTLTIPSDWTPGDYLFKLVNNASQSYVPLTIRDDKSHSDVLVINAVTTWQAYNDWGGYSLYHGPANSAAKRADIVTFDRPYARDGAGDFISNEHGLVALAERMGLDVTYTTDIDVHEHPQLLKNHHVVVSLGHDEYWTKTMREGVESARDNGVNVMFLGANALFRRIRLQPSSLGADRDEVNYRTTSGDTGLAAHPDEPTTSWRDGPHARPESSLTGVYYECNPVNVDGVVANPDSWVFAGTGLKKGSHLKLLIGTEYDRVTPSVPTPSNIEVLLHSPLKCQGHSSFADAAYYTAPSGAGVFSAGTGAWVCKLFSGCPADKPFAPDPLIEKITENVLRVFAAGPAGKTHPSNPNTSKLRIGRIPTFNAHDEEEVTHSSPSSRQRSGTPSNTFKVTPGTTPAQTTPTTHSSPTTPPTTG